MSAAVLYDPPSLWISYDTRRVVVALTDAKAAVLSLTNMPSQRAWADRLQEVQLKQEVAGTSRIEGAEFTESELDAAINNDNSEGLTRSQRQARAAVNAYRWISALDPDRPITPQLICEVHRRIVTDCDDDHCPPGVLRESGQNVVFGTPRHRGVEGGKDCAKQFAALCESLTHQFNDHDVLIRALAVHYHVGAMHPFLDGNGRTARAMEALILQRSGLRDQLFIALSNYYYDEKTTYLKTLASVRASGGDMTEFLVFGLRGITVQCGRLFAEIKKNVLKALFRDMARDLFDRLPSAKKRVIGKRQMAILSYLVDRPSEDFYIVFRQLKHLYNLKEPWPAAIRDVRGLEAIGAIQVKRTKEGDNIRWEISVRLEWATEVTDTKFFEAVKTMPRSKGSQIGPASFG